MVEQNRFNWRLSLYAAVGTLIIFLTIVISGIDLGLGQTLYVIVVAPVVSLVLLILAIRKKSRQRLSVLAMLVVFVILSVILVENNSAVREAARWFLLSKAYKAKALAQPDSAGGELKHVEWDGWGWAGQDTTVYLVFDPNDSLATEVKDRPSGKFNGIPCEVPRIRRLERQWYSVMFYTETDWTHCK
jgi:hypothetical protein